MIDISHIVIMGMVVSVLSNIFTSMSLVFFFSFVNGLRPLAAPAMLSQVEATRLRRWNARGC